MRWALILSIFFSFSAAAEDLSKLSETNRAHLLSMQEARGRSSGRMREILTEKIFRFRLEYGLDVTGYAPVGWRDPRQAQAARQAEQAGRARQAEEMFREELKRRAAENERRAARQAEQKKKAEQEWARQQAELEANERMKKEAAAAAASKKEDFLSAAQAELRRKEFLKQAQEEVSRRPQYRSREEFDRAFASHLKFAQDSVAEGGLGFVPAEARQWAEKMMREKTNDQIYSVRFRYNRALKFAKTPKELGGPGYERGYARKVALEAAMRPEFNAVEDWIQSEKAKLAKARSNGCRGWFGVFD